jgi:hypothetical protein
VILPGLLLPALTFPLTLMKDERKKIERESNMTRKFKLGEEPKEPSDYIKRVSLRVTPEQMKGLNKIPWGLRNQLFSSIIDDLLYMFDNQGQDSVIAMIIGKRLKLSTILENAPSDLLKGFAEFMEPPALTDEVEEAEKEEKDSEPG